MVNFTKVGFTREPGHTISPSKEEPEDRHRAEDTGITEEETRGVKREAEGVEKPDELPPKRFHRGNSGYGRGRSRGGRHYPGNRGGIGHQPNSTNKTIEKMKTDAAIREARAAMWEVRAEELEKELKAVKEELEQVKKELEKVKSENVELRKEEQE